MMLLLLMAGADWAFASSAQEWPRDISADFTHLDWNELRIDSTLPRYTEVIPLESDYRRFDYKVTLDYPEYQPLTHAESLVAEQFDSLVSEDIQVNTFVGVERRVGMLDVSFVPVIRREGKYLKLISARITITPVPKSVRRTASSVAVTNGRYAEHSVLSSGRWVKIYVTADGVYALTRSRLRRMGFNNPDQVRLFGYGGYRQNEVIQADTDYDDLQEIPLFKQNDDTWLFWANGLLYWEGNTRVFNPYATKSCYFLTEGGEPATLETMAEVPASSSKVQISTFVDHILYEKDEYA